MAERINKTGYTLTTLRNSNLWFKNTDLRMRDVRYNDSCYLPPRFLFILFSFVLLRQRVTLERVPLQNRFCLVLKTMKTTKIKNKIRDLTEAHDYQLGMRNSTKFPIRTFQGLSVLECSARLLVRWQVEVIPCYRKSLVNLCFISL